MTSVGNQHAVETFLRDYLWDCYGASPNTHILYYDGGLWNCLSKLNSMFTAEYPELNWNGQWDVQTTEFVK